MNCNDNGLFASEISEVCMIDSALLLRSSFYRELLRVQRPCGLGALSLEERPPEIHRNRVGGKQQDAGYQQFLAAPMRCLPVSTDALSRVRGCVSPPCFLS